MIKKFRRRFFKKINVRIYLNISPNYSSFLKGKNSRMGRGSGTFFKKNFFYKKLTTFSQYRKNHHHRFFSTVFFCKKKPISSFYKYSKIALLQRILLINYSFKRLILLTYIAGWFLKDKQVILAAPFHFKVFKYNLFVSKYRVIVYLNT